MALNPATHILALQQSREPRRRRRAAIGQRGVAAAGLTTGRRSYSGKPDDTVAKPKGFAIENTDLSRFGYDGPICRGRAEKIGRQTKSKKQRGKHRKGPP